MEEPSQNVLSDAKAAYTKQLVFTLAPRILEGFMALFEDAVQFKEDSNDPRYDDYSEIEVFQDSLRKIPKWNQDIIDNETKRIVDRSKCEYLEDLLAAVFISHAKVMSSIRFHNPSQQMKLKIPKLRNFVHKCYVECSREIYQNVYLFDNEDVTTFQKQKNIREVTTIIKEGIVESVEKLLPTREIIKTYLGKIYDDEDTTTSIEESGFAKNMFMDFAQKLKGGDIDLVNSDNEQAAPKEQFSEESEAESEAEPEPEPEKLDDNQKEFAAEESESAEEPQSAGEENVSEEEHDVQIHMPEESSGAEEEETLEPLEQTPENVDERIVKTVPEPEPQTPTPTIIQQMAAPQQPVATPPPVEEKIIRTQPEQPIDFHNYLPKVASEPQLSQQVIQQIEKKQEPETEPEHKIDAVPLQKFVQNDDQFEAVSVDESTKFSEIVDPSLKTILPTLAQNVQPVDEVTSDAENIKRIEIMNQQMEHRREKEERRRRKLLRHKHKKQQEMQAQAPAIQSTFLSGGAPEYVEDEILA